MALSGARYTGAVAASLASLIGGRKQYRMLQFTIPAANAGAVFIATTAAGGATTINSFALGVDATWQISPGGDNVAAGEIFTIDPTAIHIKGADGADECYIAYLT